MLEKWRVHFVDGSGYVERATQEEAQAYASEVGSDNIEHIQEEQSSEVTQEPDWDALLDAIAASEPEFLAALRSAGRWDFILARLGNIAETPTAWKGESDRLLLHWNAAPPNLDEGQRAALGQLAEQHFLPLLLQEDNQLRAV